MSKVTTDVSNCDKQNAQLLTALEQYNLYLMDQISKIEDFDIWYEQNFKSDFPKCWYSIIKNGKS